jgi:hypothetical protein
MHRIVVLILTVAIAASCSARPGGPTARVDRLLGAGVSTRMLTQPGERTQVEAYRIDGMAFMEGRADGAEKTIQGFPVLAGPVPVDAPTAGVLADVLGSDDTYLWDVAKACEFLPGVAYRYREPGTTVDVLICFSCDELEVFVNDAKVGHEDFDPRRRDLVRIAKKLFPQDAKIQSLKP